MPEWVIPIWDFIVKNISNILSLIGIGITIRLADKAKTAAEAAKSASEDTKNKIYHIKASLVIQECIHDTENIIRRIELDNWESVSDFASRVRKNLIMAKSNISDNSLSTSLEEIIVQIKIINEASDKAKHGSGRPPNKSRFISTIRLQVDAMTEIQQNVVSSLSHKDAV